MKKNLFLGLVILISINVVPHVYVWKNGELSSIKPDSITFRNPVVPTEIALSVWENGVASDLEVDSIVLIDPYKSTATVDDHAYVDLGLSSRTLWATCNVGADSPEDFGNYYSWAETDLEKNNAHCMAHYKYLLAQEGVWIWTKYNLNLDESDSFRDGKTELDSEDDAATVNWGAKWKTPTAEQLQELINEANPQIATLNGVKGYRFVGPNGNSIFLPAAGYFFDANGYSTMVGQRGFYWSRNLSIDSYEHVQCLFFLNEDGFGQIKMRKTSDEGTLRYYGRSIRPVYVP